MEETPGGGGYWSFAIAGAPAFVQTQSNVDRMRIVATVGNPRSRDRARLTDFMEANYHTALDVRYCISDGKLTAAFLHPLNSLSRDQFDDALKQVSLAVRTAGAENASSPLTYGRPASATTHQYENPAVENDASDSPAPYQPPPIVKDILIPLLTALIGASAALLSTWLA